MAALFLCACGNSGGDPARGQALFEAQTINDGGTPACSTCHSLEADVVIVGPSLAGIAGRAANRIKEPGYRGFATDAEGYLRESILQPNVYIVDGFAPGLMFSSFANRLEPQQLDDLIAYLLTLE